MSKVCVFDHPLIQHKLSILRDKNTSVKVFRELVSEITTFLAYDALRDIKTEEVTVQTPLAKTVGHKVAEDVVLVPILRAFCQSSCNPSASSPSSPTSVSAVSVYISAVSSSG